MPRIYLEGANIVIDVSKSSNIKDYLPSHSTFMRPKNNSTILIQNNEVGKQDTYAYTEIEDEDGNSFATYEDTLSYLADFVGSFKKGGGSVFLGASKFSSHWFEFTPAVNNTWVQVTLPEEFWDKMVLVKITTTSNNNDVGAREYLSSLGANDNLIRIDNDSATMDIVPVDKQGRIEAFARFQNDSLFYVRAII